MKFIIENLNVIIPIACVSAIIFLAIAWYLDTLMEMNVNECPNCGKKVYGIEKKHINSLALPCYTCTKKNENWKV